MTRYEKLRKMATEMGLRVRDFDLGDGRTKGYTINGGPEGSSATVMINGRNQICIYVEGNERIFMTDYIKTLKRGI